MPTRSERIRGGLVGLLVGDALGVPYEFHAPHELPPQVEMTPPEGFRRAHPGVPPGTWSDDGAQALALLASLLDRGHLDPDDLGARLVAWRERGAYTADGRVFDIGIQTTRALDALSRGVSALQAGPSGEYDNGNGALMRVLPLALWHAGPDADLVRDAHDQSRPTHGHPRSQVCCALYVLWARGFLEERPDPWGAAVDFLRRTYDGAFARELDLVLAFDRPTGSGYVVDSLHVARVALQAGDYEAVVRRAIAFGHDTDTTACIAGGLAGVRDGLDAVPSRWRRALRGRSVLDPLLGRLLGRLVDA